MEQLFNLVKKFILQPVEAWELVKDDSATAKQHLVNYILPLVIISSIATFLGHSFIGYGIVRPSFSWGLSEAVTTFVLLIAAIYVSGFIIQKLAPSFGTQVTFDKTIKLVGFSYTPVLVAGILNIFPALGILVALAGLYSLYVLYTGFKPMTGVSEDKSLNYFIVSIIVIIAVYFVLALILGALFITFGIGKAAIF